MTRTRATMPTCRRLPVPLALALLITALALLPAGPARAEQMLELGRYEAHYSVIPTTLLKPAIAADYEITRARDRVLVNIAIIDPASGPVGARVAGTAKDLLGFERALEFAEVREGEAIYYLATLEHADEETMRFAIDVQTPDGATRRLEFQQKLYWEAR